MPHLCFRALWWLLWGRWGGRPSGSVLTVLGFGGCLSSGFGCSGGPCSCREREGGNSGSGTAPREDSEAPQARSLGQLTCNTAGANTNARTDAGTHTRTHADPGA